MEPVKEPKVYRDPDRTKILWIGKIIAKEFTPEPAQEITVGQGGLQSTRVEGEYVLQVETPDGAKVYNVWVDRTVYEEARVGDDYYVIPSP
jgi:hypothetical protein